MKKLNNLIDNAREKLKMFSKQPSLNKSFFGELDENLQNRIIFSSYLKSKSDLICLGRSEGKLRGGNNFYEILLLFM